MNRETAVRQGFYETLVGMQITIPEVGPFVVPVYAAKNESDEELYVIIASQFAQNRSDMACYRWKASIEIEIYHAQQNSATFDYVDIISEKIEQLILPTSISAIGLTAQNGWYFHAVQLESVNSMSLHFGQSKAKTVVAKSLQFSLIISKI